MVKAIQSPTPGGHGKQQNVHLYKVSNRLMSQYVIPDIRSISAHTQDAVISFAFDNTAIRLNTITCKILFFLK